jgi:hypothetical protein
LEPEVYHLKPKNNTTFFKRFTGMLPRSVSWYGAYLFKVEWYDVIINSKMSMAFFMLINHVKNRTTVVQC